MDERADGPMDESPTRMDPTGVPGLDSVLGGGLPHRALAMLVGPPGSGKTTLAAQIAFAAARTERRVLIFTARSEPGDKLVDHLRTFSFFDEALIGDAIRIISIGQYLPGGLEATAHEVLAVARGARAGLVVLDGFRGVLRAVRDEAATQAFLFDLSTALGVQGTTTIVTHEAQPRDTTLFPEATIADVLVGLHYDLVGMRPRREVEAIKVRGAAPLLGLHPLVLDAAGATVYPRLETRLALTPPAADEAEPGRAVFDLPELDRLLGDGLPARTVTLVLGNPGTGKTLLGLHFALAGAAAGVPTFWLSLREGRAELLRAAAAFGLGAHLRAALDGGGLTFRQLVPVEMDPDVAAGALLDGLDVGGARRLVLDGLTEMEAALDERGDAQRARNYLTALVMLLRARGTTALLLKETRGLTTDVSTADGALGVVVADNVLILERRAEEGRLWRTISAPKVRFSAHDERVHAFEIVPPAGIRVLGSGEGGREAGRPGTP